jgi:hypothetical protein
MGVAAPTTETKVRLSNRWRRPETKANPPRNGSPRRGETSPASPTPFKHIEGDRRAFLVPTT